MKNLRQRCENCGADLEIDEKKGLARCPYCRSVFQLETADRQSARAGAETEAEHRSRVTADDVRMKQLEYEHERMLHESRLKEKEKAAWRMGVLLYAAALFISYMVISNTSVFGAVALFGGIALYLTRPGNRGTVMPGNEPAGFRSPAGTAPYMMSSPKSKWIALLLCFFFGIFGVHYFYVGRTGMGIVYLLTMGFFGIGWLVDMIRILAGAFRDRYGLPLDA